LGTLDEPIGVHANDGFDFRPADLLYATFLQTR
jgi:hypothetical protein